MPAANTSLSIARTLLLLSALLHLCFGLIFIFSPSQMMEKLSIAATSPSGLIEMRTFYGGLMFAMGSFFTLGVMRRELLKPALIMLAITYLAAVLTRTYGIVRSTQVDSIIWNILTVEVIGLISAIAALTLIKKYTDHST